MPNLTQPDNTHHIKLTDGTNSTYFVLTDQRGKKTPLASRIAPYPKMASKLAQGRSRYADQNPPFEDIALSDFSGGRGNLHFDEDKSQYWDGKRIDTRIEGRVLLGGQETYCTGIRDFDQSWPGDLDWLSLYSGGTTSKKVSFAAGASYNANSVVVILRKTGSPTGNVQVELLDATDTQLKSKTLAIGTDCLTDLESERVEFTFASVQALTSSTTYKVQVTYSGGDSSNYVDVGVDGSSNPFYRVLDDTGDFDILPFEYKGGLYAITQPADLSASKLYLLGYRGAADSNSGVLTKLNDSTASFATNEISMVKIVAGPGVDEKQPWRVATSNDGTSITCASAWNITHTTDTEYVALSDRWQLLETFSYYVTDVSAVGIHVFIAFGTDQGYKRYRAYNDGGTWTTELSSTGHYEVQRLLAYKESIGERDVTGGVLYSYYHDDNTHQTNFNRSSIPWTFHDVINEQEVILPSGTPMDSTDYTDTNNWNYDGNTRINVAAAFTTGDMAHKNIDATDFTHSHFVGMYINIGNTRAAGDLQFGYADSGGNRINIDLPALTGEWQFVTAELSPDPSESDGAVDESDITDIYIKATVDMPGDNIQIRSGYGIRLLGAGYNREEIYYLPDHSIWNKIMYYAGGAGQTAPRPWLIGPSGAYYKDGDDLVPLVLKEMEEFAHARNGEGATTHDVYLVFNMGESIQSYYSGQMSSIGFNEGYGLPENRRGIPCSLSSYPGMLVSCCDADTDGYSSILYRRNHGWHEAYRAPEGERITATHIYAREEASDMLFFNEGADIAWIPISLNPETEDGYEYTYEGVLETGRIYASMREMQKYFHAITLITEDLDADCSIEIDFKTDGDTSWTALGTTFNTSPRQYQTLASTNDTTGYWIQLRFRLYTNDNTKTPVLTAAILDALRRGKTNLSYVYQVLCPMGYGIDLRGGDDVDDSGSPVTGKTKWDQVLTWINSPDPLTLTSVNDAENNKTVFVEPAGTGVVRYHEIDGNETRTISLKLIGVDPVGE